VNPVAFWEDGVQEVFDSVKYDFVYEEEFNNYFKGGDSCILRDSVYDDLFDRLDPAKSPGFPLNISYPHNKGLMDVKAEFKQDVEATLDGQLNIGRYLHSLRADDPKKLYELCYSEESHLAVSTALSMCGYIHPYQVKVKGEERKSGKSPRLVVMVSAINSTCSRVTMGNHLITEQSIKDLPTCTRLDITSPEGRSDVWKSISDGASASPVFGSDVQGWDYACGPTEHWSTFAKMCRCMGLVDEQFNPKPGKERHYFTLFGDFFTSLRRVVLCADGNLYVIPPGIEGSGELRTFSANSHNRALLSYRVKVDAAYPTLDPVKIPVKAKPRLTEMAKKFVKSAGDDCAEGGRPNIEKYKARGFVLTGVAKINPKEFSFCSTTFRKENAYQERIEKYTAGVLRTIDRLDSDQFAERLVGFQLLFEHHPDAEVYYQLLLEEFRQSAFTTDLSDVEGEVN